MVNIEDKVLGEVWKYIGWNGIQCKINENVCNTLDQYIEWKVGRTLLYQIENNIREKLWDYLEERMN